MLRMKSIKPLNVVFLKGYFCTVGKRTYVQIDEIELLNEKREKITDFLTNYIAYQ